MPAFFSRRTAAALPLIATLFACSPATETTPMTEPAPQTETASTEAPAPRRIAMLEIYTLETRQRSTVYEADVTGKNLEAPNWSRDGQSLIFNSGGLLYRIPVAGGEPVLVDTGPLKKLNNDHGLNRDGSLMAVSDQTEDDNLSRIYILPSEGGGEPRLVTPNGPSYWHAWSPDGETLVYAARREETGDDFELYAIPAAGGEETRLTVVPGVDDGPDFSPDGQYLYFNSERTGNMKIWRMRPDGSELTQLTFDDGRDWFPHPSPDGKKLVFVTFGQDVAPGDHPPNKDVFIRMVDAEGGEPETLFALFGGQGTMNVPSWAPDGSAFAFVSYRIEE